MKHVKEMALAWLRARLAEKTTKAAIASWLATVTGLGAGAVGPMEALVGGAIGLLLFVVPTSKMGGGGGKVGSPALVLLVALCLVLTACGAAGMNKQQYSGINQVTLQTGGGCAAEDRKNQDTCQLKMVDGKEKATVMIKVILADGTTYEYSAGDEKAFEGQGLRADVDKAVADKLGEVASKAIDALKPKLPVPD